MTCNASSSDPGPFPRDVPKSGPVLVLCAVEERLAVVLAENGRVLQAELDQGQGLAMTFLAPAVGRVLDRAALTPQGLSGVACVRGPGSFTGIRVGLALCRGLCLGAGVPSWGLDYLPLVARGAVLGDPAARRVAAVVHARKGLVYFQAFQVEGENAPAPLAAACVLAIREAADLVASLAAASGVGPLRVAGTGLRNNREVFATVLEPEVLLSADAAFPEPAALALASTGASRDLPAPVEPLYLRTSDAEENLAAVAGERGLSTESARAALGVARSSLPS